MRKARVAILLSGRGSNAAALIDACSAADFPAEIVLVISNVPGAPGLALAAHAGVATMEIDHRLFGRDRAAHERAIDVALQAHNVQFVCLAGYMRLLTPWLVARWQGRMLNIHPSLLPALPGLDTHARALADGHARHGCTVHLVTDIMDDGPILGQAAIDVQPGDDPASLAARVLAEEHRLYPECLRAYVTQGQPGLR